MVAKLDASVVTNDLSPFQESFRAMIVMPKGFLCVYLGGKHSFSTNKADPKSGPPC